MWYDIICSVVCVVFCLIHLISNYVSSRKLNNKIDLICNNCQQPVSDCSCTLTSSELSALTEFIRVMKEPKNADK